MQIAVFRMNGEENRQRHFSLSEARKWLGYMLWAYGKSKDFFQLYIIDDNGKKITDNIIEKW